MPEQGGWERPPTDSAFATTGAVRAPSAEEARTTPPCMAAHGTAAPGGANEGQWATLRGTPAARAAWRFIIQRLTMRGRVTPRVMPMMMMRAFNPYSKVATRAA